MEGVYIGEHLNEETATEKSMGQSRKWAGRCRGISIFIAWVGLICFYIYVRYAGERAFRVAVLGSGCRQNDVNKRLIFNLRLTSRD